MDKLSDRFPIGELAKRANVNRETIRYYERRGLIPKPPRNDSGHRQYSEIDVKRTWFIKRTQSLGFSLKEIHELLLLKIQPETKCTDIQKIIESKISDIDQKIENLVLIKATLKRLAGGCTEKWSVSDCPVLDELENN